MKYKTRKEIAQEFNIDRKSLYRKLKAAGIFLKRGLVSLEDQERIYAILGKSMKIIKEQDD